MKIIRGLHNLPVFTQATAVTIGNFDGLHLGHQQIIQGLQVTAKELGLATVVVLFEPQPLEFLQPDSAPSRLTPLHEKIRLFAKLEIDYLVCLRFDANLMHIPAQAFIDDILIKRLNVRTLFVGDDFRFGYKRQGNHALLMQAAAIANFQLASCPTVMLDGNRISSTRVRQALLQPDFPQAAALLGRPYALNGRIKHGDKRGRLLGFPTANIVLKHDKLILSGVFAVTAVLENQQSYQGVANLGLRPTVDGLQRKLEVHLFDFDNDLYGQCLEVIFKHKLRDEQRFADIDALKYQIQQDVIAAKNFFEMEKNHD